MSVLTDAAAQAYASELAAAEAGEQQRLADMTNKGKQAVAAVIAPVTLQQAALQISHRDLENRIIIGSDGTISLGAREKQDGTWEVGLVAQVDGEWTRKSGPLKNLADLGEAIAEASA